MPGGRPALAAALGLVQTPDAARFVSEVARAVYEVPEDRSREADARAARLAAYLAAAARTPPTAHAAPTSCRCRSTRRSGAARSSSAPSRPRRSSARSCPTAPRRSCAYGLAALDDETLAVLAESS